MKIIETDILVIGAGPSGCVSASILHANGVKTVVVEKEKFPRFVIGESLLPRGMEVLEQAGFLDVLKTKGFQQKFGAKFVRGESDICDFNFSEQYTKGWDWTWQVPRAEFDQTLASELQRRGVPVYFEHTVTDIKFTGSDSQTTVLNNQGETILINAKFIIDSSGYGRVIPRLFNLDRPSGLPRRKTMFVHTTDTNRLKFHEPNRILFNVLEQGTWVWNIPFSNGITSVGFVSDPTYFERFDGVDDEKMWNMLRSEPYLKERYSGQTFQFTPRVIEGWSVTTDKFYGTGFVLTGNVTEFLDPIFSSGVTLALVSGARAAELLVKKMKGGTIDWETEFMQPTMRGVDVFRSYVNGWYNGTLQTIFFSKTTNHDFKDKICSVLAGYVWDDSNPFVKKHDKILKTLADVIKIEGEV